MALPATLSAGSYLVEKPRLKVVSATPLELIIMALNAPGFEPNLGRSWGSSRPEPAQEAGQAGGPAGLAFDRGAEDAAETVPHPAGGLGRAGTEGQQSIESLQHRNTKAFAVIGLHRHAPTSLEGRPGKSALLRGDDGYADMMGIREHTRTAPAVDVGSVGQQQQVGLGQPGQIFVGGKHLLADFDPLAELGQAIEQRLVGLGIGSFDDAMDHEPDLAMTVEDMLQGLRQQAIAFGPIGEADAGDDRSRVCRPGGAGARGQPRARHDADFEVYEVAIEVGHRWGLAIGLDAAGAGPQFGEGGARFADQACRRGVVRRPEVMRSVQQPQQDAWPRP